MCGVFPAIPRSLNVVCVREREADREGKAASQQRPFNPPPTPKHVARSTMKRLVAGVNKQETQRRIQRKIRLKSRGIFSALLNKKYKALGNFSTCNPILEVCHPRCVCENWKGYVVKHSSVN